MRHADNANSDGKPSLDGMPSRGECGMRGMQHAGMGSKTWWNTDEFLWGSARPQRRNTDSTSSHTFVHISHMPMNQNNPFSNIIRGVEADVLWALCEDPIFQTATAIARECGRSRSEVRVVLNYFAATEIVTVFQDGGYKFFRLNTQHPLHKEVMALSQSFLRQGITTRNSFA
jgi:hypothetical protein